MKKIGILTFHSQTNYGGVLQAFALQRFLENNGYEAKVLDLWMSSNNEKLLGPFVKTSLRVWLSMVLRSLLGAEYFARAIRCWKSIRFVRRMNLTDFSFLAWGGGVNDELTKSGITKVVVGSDQVWNCVWQDPGPYLMEGAPEELERIAYATSFGMVELPSSQAERYTRALRKFMAISMREREGVGIVNGLDPSFDAIKVLDPTLMVPNEVWFNMSPKKRTKRHIVCYFLATPMKDVLPRIKEYSADNDCTVTILTDEWNSHCNINIKYFVGQFRKLLGLERVNVKISAGHKDFVDEFARATDCVSDSFHALMFSVIYNLNVRILKPTSAHRLQMFSRIEEFCCDYCEGKVVCEDVEEAVGSLDKYKTTYKLADLERDRAYSQQWLLSASK